jgi:hypothetical protein
MTTNLQTFKFFPFGQYIFLFEVCLDSTPEGTPFAFLTLLYGDLIDELYELVRCLLTLFRDLDEKFFARVWTCGSETQVFHEHLVLSFEALRHRKQVCELVAASVDGYGLVAKFDPISNELDDSRSCSKGVEHAHCGKASRLWGRVAYQICDPAVGMLQVFER